MQWDDLRYVLAVHRSGSVAGAARTLGVSNVTVFRRIGALEKTLGVRLFDRKRKGYVATPGAAAIVEQAVQIEAQIKALEHQVWQHDKRVHGSIRLTVTDTFGATLFPQLAASLREQFPDLRIEALIRNSLVDLAGRDAEIAIRSTTSPPQNLIGHNVSGLAYAVFAAKSFAARHLRRNKDLACVPWVTLNASYSGNREATWLRRQGYDANIAFESDSFLALATAVRAGVGVGVLSCMTAGALGGMVRVSPIIRELENQVWILTHPELREVARVSAVYAFLREKLIELKPRFMGAG